MEAPKFMDKREAQFIHDDEKVRRNVFIIGTAVKLKWTPGNKNSGAKSGQDGVTCSRYGSVGAFCMK